MQTHGIVSSELNVGRVRVLNTPPASRLRSPAAVTATNPNRSAVTAASTAGTKYTRAEVTFV